MKKQIIQAVIFGFITGTIMPVSAMNNNEKINDNNGISISDQNLLNYELLNSSKGFIGNIKNAENCISNGANVNIQDNNGLTPLHYAAFHENFEIAKLLIKSGADVNIKDNNGLTPLQTTCITGEVKTAKLLIQNGANINIKNTSGKTAFDIASQKYLSEMITYLQNVQNEFTNFKQKPSAPTTYAPKIAYLKMLFHEIYPNTPNIHYLDLSQVYVELYITNKNNELETLIEKSDFKKNLSNNQKALILTSGFDLTSEQFNMKKEMIRFNNHFDCHFLF